MYEFGFGLSYTTLELSNLKITKLTNVAVSVTPAATTAMTPDGNSALWAPLIKVTATISNTGDLVGAAVPQLYLSLPDIGVNGTTVQQLRGFEEIKLGVNGTNTVRFELMRRHISYWDVVLQESKIPSGTFGLKIGLSSRDARVKGVFVV